MKTNTKKSFLKLAMTVMAMLLFTSAWAQTHDGTIVPGSGLITPVTYADDGVTYMVVGDVIPVYAKPDPVYHPAWDYAAEDWTLTDDFLWNWSRTSDVGDTGLGAVTFSQNNAQDNYVQISIDEIGQYEIQVTETASAAFGGCVGTGTVLAIQVVATPDATLDGAGTSPSFCASDVTIPTSIDVDITGGWQNYRLVWSLEIATLSDAATKDEWFATDKTTDLADLAKAVEYTEAIPHEVASSGVIDIITVAGGFTVINDKPTVYTYTLTSINDQALRFGDFITLNGDDSNPGAFRYNAIGETYSIQVNPAPVTGPIYHIPSTWGQ